MPRFAFPASVILLVLIGEFLQAAESRPNILFILSDDHATQAISAYGSKLNKTPNIDRLAAEGMKFNRCYVTNSICGPSRACILTGKYSHKNGYYAHGQEFDGGQTTFPKLLRAADYQTAVVGKWHLNKTCSPTGFDYFEVLQDQGFYYQPKFITPLGEIDYVGYTTNLITDRALNWLEKGRDSSKPFLLMLHHKAPHRPWDPAPERMSDYVDHEFPEPVNLFDDYKNRSSAAAMAEMRIADHMNTQGPDLKAWDVPEINRPADNQARNWFYGKLTGEQLRRWKPAYHRKNEPFYSGKLAGRELTRWKYQRYLQDYLSCVASVDDGVGKVLDYLDSHGLTENTVVIYSSDQGFFLGEHGWFDKRFMYEESLKMPLLVRWPGITKPGSVEDRIVSNLDFAETMLDIAGVEIPADMQGNSFTPLLRGELPPQWRQAFYYHYYEGANREHKVCEHYGVTTGKHKLIHFYKIDEWELFDLERDPQEMNSVYGDPEYAQVQTELLKKLDNLRTQLQVTSNDPPQL